MQLDRFEWNRNHGPGAEGQQGGETQVFSNVAEKRQGLARPRP